MKRSVVARMAVMLAVAAQSQLASAQSPPQCNAFLQLRTDAQQRATAVRTAVEHKAERKEICNLMQRFYASEGAVVKFLVENKTWCNIPPEAIKAAKENHDRTDKMRTAACAEGPAKPRAPSLSDAINTPSVDTGKNTKTGQGTLDSLGGNPLAK